MTTSPPITTLFLDIGGVLLTNGWDHNFQRRAADKFGLNYEEMSERHHSSIFLSHPALFTTVNRMKIFTGLPWILLK
jgi:hypothetical protein